MGSEYRFLTDTPHSREDQPPAEICTLADEVLEGLRIALRTFQLSPPERYMDATERLRMATTIMLRWFEDLPKIKYQPLIEVGQKLQAMRLGRLHNGEYALFDDPVGLEPSKKYTVNYICDHNPPWGKESQDTMPGFEFQKQFYLGYAPPSVTDMDGYAISLNHFLTLEEQQIVRLDAEPTDDLKQPYYEGFPQLASS